jgi:hypothetical protein
MKTYIFGYGSLINKKYSIELNDINKTKIIPVMVLNLERDYIVINNKLYFGIKDNSNCFTNGVLINVSSDEIINFDMREKYYTRKILDKNRILFIYDKYKLSKDDIVYIYYPTNYDFSSYIQTEQAKKYITICLEGCIDIGKQFLIDFILHTKNITDSIKHLFNN